MSKVSSHDHFILTVKDLVQELLDIDKEDRTTFEQHALKRMLTLLGRDPREANCGE
jgi:hypothetical protein